MMKITTDIGSNKIFNALLRTSLKAFVMKVFQEVSPSNQYSDNWHIDLICQELNNMINDSSRRLIVNIPPRYMKSIICSVALPAFLLGHNPKTSIICVSYADDLASKHANDCRKVITSKWYQELFPNTKLSNTRKSTFDFETIAGGGRFSTSVNGTLTGRGADWIIIDDPLKPIDANSDIMREKVNEWYRSTLYSRLNDKASGKIMLIMQRLHENDLTGFLLEHDKNFKLIKLPIIAEAEENWTIYDPIIGTNRKIIRHIGDLLHPARENRETVLELQQSLGEFAFAGQYQQNPAPISGGIVKKEWLHYYNEVPNLQKIVLSWDTAGKEGSDNAYSACVVVGTGYDNKYYLLECSRYRLDFPKLVNKATELYMSVYNEFSVQPELIIEDASSGTQLIQCLRGTFSINIHDVKPHQDKVSRMQGTSLLIEQGKLLFPNIAGAWYKDFEAELTTFPKSRFKDQCDALSQAMDFLANMQTSKVQPCLATGKGCYVSERNYYSSGGHYYSVGHRNIYKAHPMRDPKKLRSGY